MHGNEGAEMMIDFGGVVDALPGLVWTTEADGRCDFVNRGWGQYTGLGLEKAIDHGWRAAIHLNDMSAGEASNPRSSVSTGEIQA
jgi:PAS domain-containing protein